MAEKSHWYSIKKNGQSKISEDALIAAYLKYSSRAKSLKALAYSQLLLKALYKAKKPISSAGLYNNVAKLLGKTKIVSKLLDTSLKDLEEEKMATNIGDKWSITSEGKKLAKNSINEFEKRLEEVLIKYFPKDINKAVIKNWFAKAAADFFGHFGDDWVKSMVIGDKNPSLFKIRTIYDLLTPSIKSHGLRESAEELIEGFSGFIHSDSNNDQIFLLDLTNSFFSARLVAADLGADLISISKISKSKLILDTNTIFALSLRSPKVAKSINSLGVAFKELDCSLVYNHETEEEYKRVIAGKRKELKISFNMWPISVLRSVRGDYFLAEAIRLKCKSEDDVERYIDSIKNLPEKIENLPVLTKEDDDQILEVLKKAKKNERLKTLIQQKTKEYRPAGKKGKSELSLNHDSALISTCIFLRKEKENAWIISLDKSLHAADLSITGPKNYPNIIPLDVLIQILALNNTKPRTNSTKFAPLLQQIIINKCSPTHDSFTMHDLEIMHSLIEEVSELPPEAIKEIGRFVSKNQIMGVSSTSNKFQREFHRKYHKIKKSTNKEISRQKENVKSTKKDLNEEIILRKRQEGRLMGLHKKEIIRKASIDFALQIIARIIAIILIYFLMRHLLIKFTTFEIIGDLISFLINIYIFIEWVKEPYSIRKKKISNSNKTAIKKVASQAGKE